MTVTEAPKYTLDVDDDEEVRNGALPNGEPASSDATPGLNTMPTVFSTSDETTGSREIIAALTKEEVESMPDPNMPLRYFRATKGNVPRAIEAMKASLAWRSEFGVRDIATCLQNDDNAEIADIIRKENSTSKMYVRGHDKEGRALVYMRPAKENTNIEGDNLKNLVFQLEKAIACSEKRGADKLCILMDFEGYQMRNAPPMSTSRKTLDILQHHYPERMHKAYICNPPFIFRTFYALIRPFIDPVTKQKIIFCHGTKGMQQVLDDVGAENAKLLEKCAGGKGTLRPCNSAEYLSLPMNVSFDEQSTGN